MGWDWIRVARRHPVLNALPTPAKFYFAHSFHAECANSSDVLATTSFGASGDVVAAFARDNVVGVQFHPEKSHAFGMSLLASFMEWQP